MRHIRRVVGSISPGLCAAVVLTACGPQRPTTTYEPTSVGIVEAKVGYYDVVTPDGGRITDVDARSLTGGVASDGDLFLGGLDDQGPWFQDAQPGPEDCPFGISSNAWDDGGFVLFESGLRVPKAEAFIGEPRALGGGSPPIICLNEAGEATEAR